MLYFSDVVLPFGFIIISVFQLIYVLNSLLFLHVHSFLTRLSSGTLLDNPDPVQIGGAALDGPSPL